MVSFPAFCDDSIPAHSLAQAQEIVGRSEVLCETPESCSPSVGQLVMIEPSKSADLNSQFKLFQCTAFPLGPDLIATAGHCVPRDLKAAGSACQGRITVFFPATAKFSAEESSCGQVLYVGNGTDDSGYPAPDYALLQMTHAVRRPVLAMSHAGFPDGAKLEVVKADPVPEKFAKAIIRTAICNTVQNTAIIPDYDRNITALVTLYGCDNKHGNSGAPILSQDGAVLGLTQENFHAAAAAVQMNAEERLEVFDDLIFGTNFACVQLPGDQDPTPSSKDCERSRQHPPGSWNLRVSTAARKSADARSAADLQKAIEGYLAKEERGTHCKWRPLAVEALTEHSSAFLAIPRCCTAESTADLKLKMPLWKVSYGYNHVLQPSSHIDAQAPIEVSFELSKSQVKVTAELREGKQTLLEDKIPVCESQD